METAEREQIRKISTFLINIFYMPKVMPNEMPNEIPNDKKWVKVLYEHLISHPNPEQGLRTYAIKLRKEHNTKDFYAIIVYAYNQLRKDRNDVLANYIYELYGNGVGRKYFESVHAERPMVTEMPIPAEAKTDEIAEKVNFETIVDHCLNQCVNYSEIKPIYDMLLELLNGVTDERWLTAKKKIRHRMATMEKNLNVTVNEGGEVVLEKHVGMEVGHVDAGGTGIIHQQN